jgi:uncharacterized protein (TIGR02266 family)
MRERRRWPRVALVAEIAYSADSPAMLRQITDVSHGGLFVDTATPLPEGTTLRLRFALPDQAEPLTLEAAVAWQQPHVGMGLRFTKLAPRDKAAIDRFVAATLGPAASVTLP